MDNYLDMMTLEGAGRRLNDTRSTLGVPLKALGCNSSTSKFNFNTQRPLSESSKKHPDMIILQKQTNMTNWS